MAELSELILRVGTQIFIMSTSNFERVVIVRTKSEIQILSDFREITAFFCFSYGRASIIKSLITPIR